MDRTTFVSGLECLWKVVYTIPTVQQVGVLNQTSK